MLLNNFIDSIKNDYNNIIPELKYFVNITINTFLPLLNNEETNMLNILVSYLINIISYKNNFNHEYLLSMWSEDNYANIKACILLLFPFINIKNGSDYNNITNLNQILYYYNTDIDNNILLLDRSIIINDYFRYSTHAISMINDDGLKLETPNNKLIYDVIFANITSIIKILEIMNYKWFVNWIHIIPISLINYHNSHVYLNTKKLLNKSNIDTLYTKISNNNFIYYNGLWIGDIYNILYTRFYIDTKKIKWLIFSYETISYKIYLIQCLNTILDLNNILNKYDPHILKIKLEILLYYLHNNKYYYTNIIDYDILKYLILYYYTTTNIKLLIQILPNVKISNINIDEETQDDDFTYIINELLNSIDTNTIITTIEYFYNNVNVLYNFLLDQLNIFIRSPYGKYLIIKQDNIQTINMSYYYFKQLNTNIHININDTTNINFKNIYNISKSLSHKNISDWVLLDKNFISLTKYYQLSFFQKLYGTIKLNKWLNLRSNIKRQIFVDYDYNSIITNIHNSFIEIYVILIFEELIYNGVLSEYNTEKLLINDLDLSNSYNFLSLEPYTNLKIQESIIYTNMLSQYKFYTFYALDSIFQINFFKHYFYHRILYITGDTGQGKSTQIPKLLLYALKVLEYKYNGKIVCTQPRIQPTIDNANRISEELGLPISMNNYYIQYKYKDGSHVNNSSEIQYLRLETDGTLIEELKSNNTLFVKQHDTFINKNLYDIIIIDEAHEHNINMDMAIAITRQACYINNTIKLVIVSATMDDDEPIYRRYFKYINDNLTSPIKQLYAFDSNIMDRRIHISPPNVLALKPIYEIYSKITIQPELIQEEAYKIILDICNKSPQGHILLFLNGKKEIINAIEYLNKVLPLDVIALPYYSDLHEKYKDLITNINNTLNNMPVNREDISIKWVTEYSENKDKLKKYNIAIIVATNIAEASITIPRLKYVIDNGYTKTNIYYNELDITTLEVKMISESSRIQRRGRVGRIDSGTVYYMYKKDERKNVKAQYKITNEDISDLILSLLSTTNEQLINNNNNPNIYTNINNTSNNSLLKIIYNNHNINATSITNNYFMNYNDTPIYLVNCIDGGQLEYNLIDSNGSFYLIHPYENNIKRNILNNIIYNDSIHTIDSTFLQKLEYFGLLLKNKTYNSNKKNNTDYINKYIKSEIALSINTLQSHFNLRLKNAICLFTGFIIKCHNELLQLLTFLNNINYSIINLTTLELKDFKKIYSSSSYTSDIIFIFKILEDIKKYFEKDFIFFNNTTLIQFLNKTAAYISYNKSNLTPRDLNLVNKHKIIPLDILITTDYIKNIINNTILSIDQKIDKWCEINYIHKKVIISYFNDIYKNNLLMILYNLNNKYYNHKFIYNYKLSINDSIHDKILKCVYTGYKNNVVLINDDKEYIQTSTSKFNILYNTLISIPNNTNIMFLDASIFYDNDDEENIIRLTLLTQLNKTFDSIKNLFLLSSV